MDLGQRAAHRISGFAHDRVLGWRTGSDRSQLAVLVGLLSFEAASLVVSAIRYDLMPVTAYFVWLLLGMLLLRHRTLVVLAAATCAAAVAAVLLAGPVTVVRATSVLILLVCVALVLLQSSRQRSGLPALLSEALLADLRDRLRAQGVVPPLPHGWDCQSAMVAADGVAYAGDFMVADLSEDGSRLELVLVDVCGKGLTAGPQALQFAGALSGLIGALPPAAMMSAANDFLLRQAGVESFATAVHVEVDLRDGRYRILSAGHPPALRWDSATEQWVVDNARGTALGVVRAPELTASEGVLAPGEGLLFYTDGVVESRTADLDAGTEWLRRTARDAVGLGWDGVARRIVRRVARGDDDRAVLVLSRRA